MDSSNCFKESIHLTGGFSKYSFQHYSQIWKVHSNSEQILFRKWISRFLQKSVIKHVKHLKRGYASSVFLIEKRDKTTRRLILNLNEFNENVVYHHFKMDRLSTVLNMVRQRSVTWQASILQMHTLQYHAWTENACYFNLRKIHINTHA